MTRSGWSVSLAACLLTGCAGGGGQLPVGAEPAGPAPRVDFAIAIHGGAGVISRSISDEDRDGYLASLEAALRLGRGILADGGQSLDAVEQVIRLMEDDPRFNAGRGAVFNHEAGHELDASIMNGADMRCGAVAAVRTVKNPISLARHVMERTSHVLLSADGAEAFATEMEVERVEPSYFYTKRRFHSLQRALNDARSGDDRGTVGVVALDRSGNLAAGTSTGGLTNKRFGRVGDSPIIGAGTYADNRTCAVSGTGKGEEFIRHAVAHSISALMQYGGVSLQEAARVVVQETLRPGDGGIIALDRNGGITIEFNTEGMYRGASDSTGRFEVAIW